MDGKRKEFVHFSLGFGIFQNDDDLTNGWNVSAAQAPYQGQNVEVEVEGEGEVEGEVLFGCFFRLEGPRRAAVALNGQGVPLRRFRHPT